eukprot:191399_1
MKHTEAFWLISLLVSTAFVSIFTRFPQSMVVQTIVIANVVIMFILLSLHYKIDGISFIMTLNYIICMCHLIFFFLHISFESSVYISVSCILIEAISATISILLPQPIIPNTTGPYLIATKILSLDTIPYINHKHQLRPFVMRLWYPTEIKNKTHRKHKCYRIHLKDQSFVNRIYPIKSDFEDGYNYTLFLSKHCLVNASLNTPFHLQQQSFPAIIYQYGQDSYPERNTWLIEELVSHGFIVCAAYHDDKSRSFPGPMKRRQVDLRITIKYIQELNEGLHDPMFRNRFDFTDGIRLMGHSFGAMASVVAGANWETSQTTDKLNAFYAEHGLNLGVKVTNIVALDPWFEYLDVEHKLRDVVVPMLVISSDGWRNYKEDNRKYNSYINKRKVCICEVKLLDAFHSSLTDFGIYHKYKFGKETLPAFVIKDASLYKEKNIPFCDIGPDSELKLKIMIEIVVQYFMGRKTDVDEYNNHIQMIQHCV